MKIARPDLAALGLCALIVVGIVVLSAFGVPVPDVLPYLATAALSAGAGLSLNGPIGTETVRTSSSTQSAPAPAPRASLPPRPAPVIPEQPAAAATAVAGQ